MFVTFLHKQPLHKPQHKQSCVCVFVCVHVLTLHVLGPFVFKSNACAVLLCAFACERSPLIPYHSNGAPPAQRGSTLIQAKLLLTFSAASVGSLMPRVRCQCSAFFKSSLRGNGMTTTLPNKAMTLN